MESHGYESHVEEISGLERRDQGLRASELWSRASDLRSVVPGLRSLVSSRETRASGPQISGLRLSGDLGFRALDIRSSGLEVLIRPQILGWSLRPPVAGLRIRLSSLRSRVTGLRSQAHVPISGVPGLRSRASAELQTQDSGSGLRSRRVSGPQISVVCSRETGSGTAGASYGDTTWYFAHAVTLCDTEVA